MLIFASEIALRVLRSDLAQNPNVPAYFLSARLQCSRLLRNCGNINSVFRRGRPGGALTLYSTDDRSELQHDSLPWQNRI